MIEPNDQRTDPERTNASTLRIPLLHAGDVFRDVLDGDGILDRQPVRLGLDARLVDENPRVGIQSSESETDVFVQQSDLRGRNSGILQLEGGGFLASEHDDVFTFDADGAGSYSNNGQASAFRLRHASKKPSQSILYSFVPRLTASVAYST